MLNCFSLGAWATGMNVSSSLTEITMIKSIGPDRDKVIHTMREFGPDYTYIITAYPPFLKALFDDDRLDWSQYDIVTAFGGEGISESMRAIICEHAAAAFGSYGASDLEINIAIETDFTVALRQAIAASPELSAQAHPAVRVRRPAHGLSVQSVRLPDGDERRRRTPRDDHSRHQHQPAHSLQHPRPRPRVARAGP
ncbi:hypothetical protein [Demequina litorisediminis]|uniref:Uncharacterized protein n=1 Tax=Demequina litorisediminis TaxID=1849022 RepID=A0ABQ6I9U5_9MICO|nr:hypothetical protein [Demequina litorisediminis]GMA34095.1 hypothetical protein GCM10025876_02990 [Demequina litorisediminis]